MPRDKDSKKKAKAGKMKPGKADGSRKDKGKKPKKAFDLSAACCTHCGKRCPLSKPKCGKGRAMAKKLLKKFA